MNIREDAMKCSELYFWFSEDKQFSSYTDEEIIREAKYRLSNLHEQPQEFLNKNGVRYVNTPRMKKEVREINDFLNKWEK